ncbi:cysteine-rich secretory protein family protein [Nitzschia inconspicua]|uniref:Cysteine-rich secretory protein family protein n=1 Tax=Nitzschia inconspicua TaxID=303405 RepID=A0A9K3PWE5_9STRA|nr:cysteine-rich secretory protein family protein [Nitzschia inconspicua]
MLLSIQQTSTTSFSSFTSKPVGEGGAEEQSKMCDIKVQPISSPKKLTYPGISKLKNAPPVMKNRTDLPGNFFTRLYSTLKVSQQNADAKKPPAPTAKGVFAIQISVMETGSLQTIETNSTVSMSTSIQESNNSNRSNESIEAVWLPSTADDHNKGLPLVVRHPQYDNLKETDDRKLLHKIMGRAKKLPQSSGKYASNHIMVNAERTRRSVPPLTRDRDLDRVARDHAKTMAKEKLVRHMDGPTELQSKILEFADNSMERQRLFFPRLGVNIARGRTIDEIHKFMMANLAERNNVLDKRFSTMGMGTARADNGMIYLCQVFGG